MRLDWLGTHWPARRLSQVGFAGPDQLVAGGHMWEETRKQFAYKPLLIVQREGRGQIVGFTADPNFRAYLDGMNLLFFNAVLRGPGHARVGGGE